MKLPASLLQTLRVSVTASAVASTVAAAGCDRLATWTGEVSEAAPAETVSAAPNADDADRADDARASEPSATSTAQPPRPSLAATVAEAVQTTRPRTPPPTPTVPAAEPDSTTVIPFDAGATGTRVAPRELTPLAFAEPPKRGTKPRKAKPKRAPVLEEPCDPAPRPVKGWDNCPACGRG